MKRPRIKFLGQKCWARTFRRPFLGDNFCPRGSACFPRSCFLQSDSNSLFKGTLARKLWIFPLKFVSWFPLSTGLLLPIDNTTTSNIIKMCIRGCTKIEINIVRNWIQLLWFIAWRSEAALIQERASPMGLALFRWDLPLFHWKNGKSSGKSHF